MRIYVTDSDYEVMKKIETFISGNPQNQVKCFTTNQIMINAIKKSPPDVVIMDFDCPNSSSAVNIIKRESPMTKIIIMLNDIDKVIELYNYGLDGFLLKPISEENLKEQLFRLKHPILAKLVNRT